MKRTLTRGLLILVNSPIVAGLIGASFGLVLANFSTGNTAGPPRWALVGIFVAAMLASAFAYNRLEMMGRQIGALERSTDLVRLDELSGGMNLVVGFVQNAKTIRVVGRARQDLLTAPGAAQHDYLSATVRAVESGSVQVYRRITGSALRQPFRDHLSTLLEKKRAGQIVEIAVVDSVDCLISYQIFDATAAIIGIETSSVPGVRDSTIVLLTHQPELISALISHFDSAWAGLHAIAERGSLESVTSVQS